MSESRSQMYARHLAEHVASVEGCPWCRLEDAR